MLWQLTDFHPPYGHGTAAAALLGMEPSGLAVDFVKNSALVRWPAQPGSQYRGTPAGLFTVSRTSEATYFGSDGLLKTAANNELRLDHSPTLAVRGLLVEEQRTNLRTQSNNFDNAAWNSFFSGLRAFGSGSTVNSAVAPDGTTTSAFIAEDTSTGQHRLYSSVAGLSATTIYTGSIFVKAGTRSRGRLLWLDAVGLADGGGFSFNLAAGTIGTPTAFGAGTNVSGSITPLANGWYRLSVSAQMNNAKTTGGIYLNISSDAGALSYTGDGSSGFYIWGGQFEAGAFATSYIPTTASQVTRAADDISIATSTFPFNSAAGTLLAHGGAAQVPTGSVFPALASLDDGTADNRIQLRRNNAGASMSAFIAASGAEQASFSVGSWSDASARRLAVAFASNNANLGYSGLVGTDDTTVNIPTVSSLKLGSGPSLASLNGHLRSVVYIPRRLLNAELQARTA